MRSDADADDLLSRRQVPELLWEQVEQFTLNALRAKPTRTFDPRAALQAMRADGNKTVMAVDVGGDKVVAATYDVRDGLLVQTTEALVGRGDGGFGYVHQLEEMAHRAHVRTLSVGISYAGQTNGTRLVTGPNLPAFLAEVHDQYGGDFANLFPRVAVANDAEAGIMAGALEATKRYPEMRHVIYVINGSGLGGAVLSDNTIFATEPGHIEVEAELNPLNQRKPCGVLGATHVCLEGVAASKAGVEDIWFQQRGERLGGREIAAKYLVSDQLALALYDNSALVMAHVIKGISRAFDLPENFNQTIVVGHGGIFHVPGYGERVRRILERELSHSPRMIFTKDFSANACLDGGAIAAVTQGPDHQDR
jgi:predicted NBD/HSP70 family sugar kinase